MKTIFLTILTLAACKTAAPDSRVASVVAPDSASGKFIVYFKETGGAGTVYRKSCQQAQIKSPKQCPTEPSSATRSWYDYERALLSTGLTPTTVNGIKEALESQTAWDVQGQTSVVQKMDQAFGIDVTKAANPFTVAFVGAPVNGAAAIPVATTTSMPLAKDLVLKEMRDAADYHTAGNTTYRGKPHPFQQDAVVSGSVRQACLDNGSAVSYWSEIVFHYYCQFGNLRACFTGQARTNTNNYDGYKKSYDYCIANDPTFQRYFSGSDPAIDYDTRRVVFQHVMFSVYAAGGTDVFAQGEQDSVINDFYKSAANCDDRPYIPRSSGDPLFRKKGSHCTQVTQQTGNTNNGNSGNGGSGLCSVTGSYTLTMKIMAPAGSSVECLYNGSPFSKPATFDSGSGYWSCADWALGNTNYQLNVRVNGIDHLTNESSIRGVPCGGGTTANNGSPGPSLGIVCATENGGKVFFETIGQMSDSFSCFYGSGGSFSPFSQNTTYDSVKNRWSCPGWTKGNPSFQIKLVLNGKNMLTDEVDALSRPCP